MSSGLSDHFKVYIFADKVVISADSSFEIASKKSVVLSKVTQDITFEEVTILNTPERVIEADGIIGIHRIDSVDYLILITQKTLITKVLSHKLFKVEKYEIVPITEHTVEADTLHHHKVIDQTLSLPGFFFSYTYDLTRSFYEQPKDNNLVYSNCEERYLWNANLVKRFPNDDIVNKYYKLPLICGFVGKAESAVEPDVVSNVVIKKVELVLISRRSNKHVGRRFYTRGVDENGNCANHVETEQLVIVGDNICSYVQLRGSVPVRWSQVPNFKYKPKIAICKDETENVEGMRKHFEEVLKRYDTVKAVSLVDQKGSELRLGQKYEEVVHQLSNPKISIECVDFHKLMKKMSELIGYMDKIFEKENYGAFLWKKGVFETTQKGIFRVNCIDSLDRTNVCESVFGRLTAQNFLRDKDVAILKEDTTIIENLALNSMFVNLWADNGDYMSNEYTGTGAQKADITRTGKRTFSGMEKDLEKSIARYVINNFFDGEIIDNMNTFLGNCEGKSVDYKLNLPQQVMFGGMFCSIILILLCLIAIIFFGKTDLMKAIVFCGIALAGFIGAGLVLKKKVTVPPKVMKFKDYEEEEKTEKNVNKEEADIKKTQ
ncbi:recessive suppressor of secretory defect, putative [Entamoeba invadens IP1]|uniref:Recessive suppressor of secretory defect, putative n=1 Tax=Entamoeba invadens IP1 TaxID=370355 RepID=A0A0A1U624_ENTIV|nr:recessive suppressor of secretory defect, putative [Entamoeba invadens IP1]ELP89775.1 recessive suppressor of secretory defect, putative [Entamoeba invadens IP1]|eukprot:XP_004256546.1 recessive suppressor of secretory defect, putative [Entamoeba invadens IP1]